MAGCHCQGGCSTRKSTSKSGTRSVATLSLWTLGIVGILGFVAWGYIADAQSVAEVPSFSQSAAPTAAQDNDQAPSVHSQAKSDGNNDAKKTLSDSPPGVIRHGRKDPIAKPDGAIRIATFNIENMFDHAVTPDSSGDTTTGSESGTGAKPKEHKAAVAEAIRKINADVIALQEIESKETLTRFRDEYLQDMGYTYIGSIDAGDPRGIEQSVLSRFPIVHEQVWKDQKLEGVHSDRLGKKKNPDAGKPILLKRSPFEAVIEVPADKAGGKSVKLTLLVVHQKSGAYYGYEREAESDKIIKLANESAKDQPNVIILGDFNAKPTETSMLKYAENGYTDAFDGVEGGTDSPDYISHVSARTIDHILLSKPLLDKLVKSTRFVLGTIQRPDGVDWRTTNPPAGYGSDHYPVVVDFELSRKGQ